MADASEEAKRRLRVWEGYFNGLRGGEQGKRAWVGHSQIEDWLGDYLIRGSVEVDTEAGISTAQAQQIIGWAWPYVPIIDRPSDAGHETGVDGGEIDPTVPPPPASIGVAGGGPKGKLMVVNRDDFAMDLARGWVAREMPRNRAR